MQKKYSFFLLFVIVIQGFATSPTQPEYASYESPDNSDMVNLLTGDFTYNLPLVNTPGPGGGYTMALSYHAGIELEEEASWVGLGWSLNAGSINRTVVQFPDDFSGEELNHSSYAPGSSGYSVNYGLYTQYYDSRKGKGGRIGLGSLFSIGYGNQSGFTAVGISVTTDAKISVDPLGVMSSAMTVATIAFPPAGVTVGSMLASTVAIDAGMSVVGAMVAEASSGDIFGDAITNQNVIVEEWRSGFLYMKKNYKTHYNGSRNDKMYGALYLGEVETDGNLQVTSGLYDPILKNHISYGNNIASERFANGAMSDVSYNAASNYAEDISPVSIASDIYQVNAKGVSGRITPYRPDIGSVSFSPENTQGNSEEIDDTYSYYIKPWMNSNSNAQYGFNYETQFKYVSELSNCYTNHIGNETEFDPTVNFKMQSALYSFVTPNQAHTNDPKIYGSHIYYGLEDSHLYNAAEYIENNRMDGTFLNGKLATGKYIEYETGHYGSNGTAAGIKSFKVTNNDGTEYNFDYPVYKRKHTFKSEKSGGAYYQVENQHEVATNWLLTSVKGPDYIDRPPLNEVGTEDWGYWVLFNYGFYGSDQFRMPYKSTEKKGNLKNDFKNDYFISEREEHYLSSIKTASHTSYFFVDVREDNRSTYSSNINSTIYGSQTYDEPSTSLKLDEIITVKNDVANHFVDFYTFGHKDDFGNNYYPSSFSPPYSSQGDASENLALPYTIDDGGFFSKRWISPDALQYLKQNQVRSIKFNYDYSLSLGCPNSFLDTYNPPTDYSGSGGKLTLNSIEIRGTNNTKLSPDYTFDYYTSNNLDNPDYGKYKYDGWGYYSSSGYDHRAAHGVTDNGAQWSLKEIHTPAGKKIRINYERDSYSSIAGLPLYHNLLFKKTTSSSTVQESGTLRVNVHSNINLQSIASVGDNVELVGFSAKKNLGTSIHQSVNLSGDYTVTEVASNYLKVFVEAETQYFDWVQSSVEGNYIILNAFEKLGGGVRVSAIEVLDELNNIEYQTKYRYTEDGTLNSLSSGVCTKEPEELHLNINTSQYAHYGLYDYPGPVVMYGKVTVYNNYKSDNEFLSKEIYEFETPNVSHVEVQKYTPNSPETTWTTNINYCENTGCSPDINETYSNKIKLYGINVKVNTARIGVLKSRTLKNVSNQEISKVSYDYGEDEEIDFSKTNIGLFTESNIMTERMMQNNTVYHRNLQTFKSYVPLKMKAFTKRDNGHTKTVHNTKWDFITGAVLETEYENTYGDRFKTEMVPAYKKYDGMGHLLWDANNKHMLSKPAASYLYVQDEDENGGLNWDLLSAKTTVWSNQWSYREYDDANNQWTWNGPIVNDAWRKKESYVWKANVNADGTYVNEGTSNDDYEEFNWVNLGLNNDHWIKSNSVSHYDHNSIAVENVSPRWIYSTRKINKDVQSVLSASNAKYTEVAYSGIEDKPVTRGSNIFLGENSELLKGANSEVESNPNHVHTGKNSLAVENGEYGIIYRIHDYTQSMDVNRNYQMSVWVKNANGSTIPNSAAMFMQYRGGGSVLDQHYIKLDNTNSKKAGDWYLFTIDIPKYSGASTVDFMELQLNCNGSTGDEIYLDDFRFYPLTATVNTSVYDSGLKTAVLNNLNLAKRVTYDDAERVVKKEYEILDEEAQDGEGGFKVSVEKKYNHGRDL